MNKDESFQTSSVVEVIQFKQIKSNQSNLKSKVAIFFILLSLIILLICVFNYQNTVSTNFQQNNNSKQKNTKQLIKQQIIKQNQKDGNLKFSPVLNEKITNIQQSLLNIKQKQQLSKISNQKIKTIIENKKSQLKEDEKNKKNTVSQKTKSNEKLINNPQLKQKSEKNQLKSQQLKSDQNKKSVNQTEKTNTIKQQKRIIKAQTTSKIIDQKLSKFKVGFIWQGQIQQRHAQKLKKLKYQFRLIRNCSNFLNDIQQLTNQPIHEDILNRIGRKSNVCRLAYLYKYGGLYLDVDADVDYECMQKFVKNNIKSTQVFFQATPKNTIDIFAIYVSQPKNPNIKHIMEIIQTYYGIQKKKDTWAFSKISQSQKIVKHSNCIKHISERTWKK